MPVRLRVAAGISMTHQPQIRVSDRIVHSQTSCQWTERRIRVGQTPATASGSTLTMAHLVILISVRMVHGDTLAQHSTLEQRWRRPTDRCFFGVMPYQNHGYKSPQADALRILVHTLYSQWPGGCTHASDQMSTKTRAIDNSCVQKTHF